MLSFWVLKPLLVSEYRNVFTFCYTYVIVRDMQAPLTIFSLQKGLFLIFFPLKLHSHRVFATTADADGPQPTSLNRTANLVNFSYFYK